MLVISWNIRAIRSIRDERLARIVALLDQAQPDLLLLQEVGGVSPARLREALARVGLDHFVFSGDVAATEKAYGNVVSSRWPLELEAAGWAPRVPWPQLLASVAVASPVGAIDVFVAHIPNGSGNGWRKIETFEALAAGLGGAPARPRILGGDFNEPRCVAPDGAIIPFGGKEGSDGSVTWDGLRFHPKSGDTHPRARWRDGVLSILGTGARHELRHAWFDRKGYVAVTTHRTRSNDRFFDHLLVSKHFHVIDAGYHLDWLAREVSDHAAAWATVEAA